jgi:hypothetical protein
MARTLRRDNKFMSYLRIANTTIMVIDGRGNPSVSLVALGQPRALALPTNRSQHFAQPSFRSTIFKGGFERQAVQGSRRGAMKPYWEERVRWPRSPMRKSRGYACGPRGASSYVPDRQNVRRQQCVHLSEYLSARNARLWQWRLHQVGVRVRNRYAVGRPAQIVSSALHRGFL